MFTQWCVSLLSLWRNRKKDKLVSGRYPLYSSPALRTAKGLPPIALSRSLLFTGFLVHFFHEGRKNKEREVKRESREQSREGGGSVLAREERRAGSEVCILYIIYDGFPIASQFFYYFFF